MNPSLSDDAPTLDGAVAAGIRGAVGLPIPVVIGFLDFDPIVPTEGRGRELFDDPARYSIESGRRAANDSR